MSNYLNELGQIHCVVNINEWPSVMEGLLNVFSNDLDFTMNEEYFRKNTLKKGFENEAHRIVLEYAGNHKITNEKQLNKAFNHMVEKVFGNDSHYRDYKTNVFKINDELYSVAISYIH
jgi:hypothetical protein